MADTTNDIHLTFCGEIRAVAGIGAAAPTQVVIATVHDEGRATELAWIDLQAGSIAKTHAVAGATALATNGAWLWAATTDGRVVRAKADGSGKLATVVEGLEPAPAGLTCCADDTLAIAVGAEIWIVQTTKTGGDVLQRLSAPAVVTALASDESGAWLVAGTESGHLAVFEREDKDAFVAAEVAEAHQGRVLALAFDPDELRVFSSATDRRLLQTFVRGALTPEDRGGSGMHDDVAAAILIGPAERWYTTGPDRTVKQWPIGRGGRPATQSDGAGPGSGLALVTYDDRPHLVQAVTPSELRVFDLDISGRLSDRVLTVHGAIAWAQRELRREPKRAEAALDALESWNDRASIDVLAGFASDAGVGDTALRVGAVVALGGCSHPLANDQLNRLLHDDTERVRVAAFDALKSQPDLVGLALAERALAVGTDDLGVRAVLLLADLAPKDEEARQRLVGCLSDSVAETRIAALENLATLYPKKNDPTAELTALRASQYADVRTMAIGCLVDRSLLGDARVRVSLRGTLDDGNAEVRDAAFLASVASEAKLAAALRALDKDLHRQLHELEHAQSSKKTPKLPKQPKAARKTLDESALGPLVDAMASRSSESCVRGASALAMLGDVRALGALLELSRDSGSGTRVAACRALAQLGDARALQRLRTLLRDDDASVRDAAFSALARLLTDDPVTAANAGLLASHTDVRKRGLSTLVAALRARAGAETSKKSKNASGSSAALMLADDDPAGTLLERALNDTDDAVSKEAFKAVLNLRVGGDGEPALRFALRSTQASVRREVLTEIMAAVTEPWGWNLLLERFDDPVSELRSEAFAFATQRARGRELDVFRAALGCRYPDLRIEATRALATRREEGALILLVKALEDPDNTVRQLAVDALMVSGTRSALQSATESEYPNVRLRAATQLAQLGDQSVLPVLLAEIETPRPLMDDERELWAQYVALALHGLSALGNDDAVPAIAPLLEYEEPTLRHGAAWVLAWCASAAVADRLESALRHEDLTVRYCAAVGLAWLGLDTGVSLAQRFVLEQRDAGRGWSTKRRPGNEVAPDSTWLGMTTALALSTDLLLRFVDHGDEDIHRRALALLLLQELASERDDPDLLIAAMTAAHPQVRLDATRALEVYGDTEAFDAVVLSTLNHRGDHESPGTLAPDQVRDLAAAVTHLSGPVRTRFVNVLWYLTHFDDENGTAERALDQLRTRYASELEAARAAVGAPTGAYDGRELALGAYIGLSRTPGYVNDGIRTAALRRLSALASADDASSHWPGSAIRAHLAAVRDDTSTVRALAISGLDTLGADASEVASEALASGHRDMAEAGLRLLTGRVKPKKARELLRSAMMERDDFVAPIAYQMLRDLDESAQVKVAADGLQSTHPDTRAQALRDLGTWAHADDAATEALTEHGLRSGFEAVRLGAGWALAALRPSDAFPILVEGLRKDEPAYQRRALNSLRQVASHADEALRNEVRDAFFDRMANDPTESAMHSGILAAIGELRDPTTVERLLPWIERSDTRWYATAAAEKATGFDQWVSTPDTDDIDGEYEPGDGQSPRRPEALATLLRGLVQMGDTQNATRMIRHARWGEGDAVSEVLGGLCTFADDGLRNAATEAYGWRVRRRDADSSPLRDALDYGDAHTQFYAAEGLGLAGERVAVGVLMTSAEMLTEPDLRRRAVRALGHLGDERALDLLLRYAESEDPFTPVYQAATEALGHLAQSAKADEIFDILVARLAENDPWDVLPALEGLRWFGTTAAWATIRGVGSSEHWEVRQRVATLLGKAPDSPESRRVLERLVVEDDDDDVASAAVASLRAHLGAESMEVDYLIVRSGFLELEDDTVARLRAHGEPERLFELLGGEVDGDPNPYDKALTDTLLAMEPPPVDAALGALGRDNRVARAVAAQLLGRIGTDVSKAGRSALEAATVATREACLALRKRLGHRTARDEVFIETVRLWARLLWACGRCGAGASEVLAAAAATDANLLLARREAISALSTGLAAKKGLAALAAATSDPDAEIRVVAAAALRQLDSTKAATCVPALLDDATALARLLDLDDATARSALGAAAADVHRQGVVAPHLIAAGEVKHLAAAAGNDTLDDPARLGAIEALGRIVSDTAADEALLAIARDDDTETALRKAAWRSLRRQKRLRARAE